MGWLVPTHARPEKLMRLAASVQGTDVGVPVTVLVWENDPKRDEYAKLTLPPGWSVVVGPAEYCGEKMNWYFKQNPHDQFYGFLGDDVQIATPGLMTDVARVAGDWNVAYPNDGVHEHKLATHFCCGGEFVRACGWWTHPTLKHNYIDYLLMEIAGWPEVGLLRYVDWHRLIVRHPYISHPEEFDETYQKAVAVNELADIYYRKILDSGELTRARTRVMEAYHGIGGQRAA